MSGIPPAQKQISVNKRILNCNVISPMFSYGGHHNVELRPTELKGLMRYMYRAANLERKTTKLFARESSLFGDAENHASPVRLQLRLDNPQSKLVCQPLLLHKPKEMRNWKSCFPPNIPFEVIIRSRNKNMDLKWYENWIKLSIILGGMGKRSRRGRGSVAVNNMFDTEQKLLEWVTRQLNSINSKEVFQLNGNEIVTKEDAIKNMKRPVIEKIQLGKEISDVNQFLKAVDRASHLIKKNCNKPKESFATGFAEGKPRFASSVIVSVTQLNRSDESILLPIYTFVKPIYRGSCLDTNFNERQHFIDKIKGGYK